MRKTVARAIEHRDTIYSLQHPWAGDHWQINVTIFKGSVSIFLLVTVCPCPVLETMLAGGDFGLRCCGSFWPEFHNCEIENRSGR